MTRATTRPSTMLTKVQSASTSKNDIDVNLVAKYTLDVWLTMCFVQPLVGGVENGHRHSVSCADLVETKDRAINAHVQGHKSVADNKKIFGRDFLAGPPIDNGGRSNAGHTGCLGRTTEGVYDIVN